MAVPTILPTNPVYSAFFFRAIGHASALGADAGECFAALRDASTRGIDAHKWSTAWQRQAERLDKHAATLLDIKPAQRLSARLAYLRASNYYRTAFMPLFGRPLDRETVMPAYFAMRQSFSKFAALSEPPFAQVEVPYQSTPLSGYLCRPPSGTVDNQRLMVLIGGYDAPMEEMYLWGGHHALQRGYSIFVFDGPGQGKALLEDSLPMSHDYDEVLGAVLRALAQHGEWKRIIVQGLSLGGLLCLKAVSGHEIQRQVDAVIADPPSMSLLTAFRSRMPFPESTANQLPEGPVWAVSVLNFMLNWMQASQSALGWTLRRGMLVHSCDSPMELVRSFAAFDNAPYVGKITIPTFCAKAEDDDLGFQTNDVFENLSDCKSKQMVTFGAMEGAGDHCEMGARQFYAETVFAWLEELFNGTADVPE